MRRPFCALAFPCEAFVNRLSGDPADQLHARHDASDFETRTQDKRTVA